MEPAPDRCRPSDDARLRALAGLADCTGASGVAREATEVAARGAEGRFHVAFVGQFPVTERENPENRRGVRAVEVFLPSPLLARDPCLVDTPGHGSASAGHATHAARLGPRRPPDASVGGARRAPAGRGIPRRPRRGEQRSRRQTTSSSVRRRAARLEAEIRGRLRESSGRARRALDDARRRRQEGQEAVEGELSRLEALRAEAATLLAGAPG